MNNINSSGESGPSIQSIQNILGPAIGTIQKNFADRLHSVDGTQLTSTDLLDLQSRMAEVTTYTQFTSQVLKAIQDLIQSIVKNL